MLIDAGSKPLSEKRTREYLTRPRRRNREAFVGTKSLSENTVRRPENRTHETTPDNR